MCINVYKSIREIVFQFFSLVPEFVTCHMESDSITFSYTDVHAKCCILLRCLIWIKKRALRKWHLLLIGVEICFHEEMFPFMRRWHPDSISVYMKCASKMMWWVATAINWAQILIYVSSMTTFLISKVNFSNTNGCKNRSNWSRSDFYWIKF